MIFLKYSWLKNEQILRGSILYTWSWYTLRSFFFLAIAGNGGWDTAWGGTRLCAFQNLQETDFGYASQIQMISNFRTDVCKSVLYFRECLKARCKCRGYNKYLHEILFLLPLQCILCKSRARNHGDFSHKVIQNTVSANLPAVSSYCGRKEAKWFSLPIRTSLSPTTKAIYSTWCHANPRSELFICYTISSVLRFSDETLFFRSLAIILKLHS